MSFFIHRQAVAAIQFLYPELINNIDYIVVMEIDKSKPITGSGSQPLADCFIAEWRTTAHEQPTIEYLKQVFADNNLDKKTLAQPAPLETQPSSTGIKSA